MANNVRRLIIAAVTLSAALSACGKDTLSVSAYDKAASITLECHVPAQSVAACCADHFGPLACGKDTTQNYFTPSGVLVCADGTFSPTCTKN